MEVTTFGSHRLRAHVSGRQSIHERFTWRAALVLLSRIATRLHILTAVRCFARSLKGEFPLDREQVRNTT